MKQQIVLFVGHGTYVIYADSDLAYQWADDHDPTALCVVCQSCGELWAKLVPEQHGGFQAINHACQRCGNGCLSNLNLVYREFTIPDDLLIREIELLAVCNDQFAGASHYV